MSRRTNRKTVEQAATEAMGWRYPREAITDPAVEAVQRAATVDAVDRAHEALDPNGLGKEDPIGKAMRDSAGGKAGA